MSTLVSLGQQWPEQGLNLAPFNYLKGSAGGRGGGRQGGGGAERGGDDVKKEKKKQSDVIFRILRISIFFTVVFGVSYFIYFFKSRGF